MVFPSLNDTADNNTHTYLAQDLRTSTSRFLCFRHSQPPCIQVRVAWSRAPLGVDGCLPSRSILYVSPEATGLSYLDVRKRLPGILLRKVKSGRRVRVLHVPERRVERW